MCFCLHLKQCMWRKWSHWDDDDPLIFTFYFSFLFNIFCWIDERARTRGDDVMGAYECVRWNRIDTLTENSNYKITYMPLLNTIYQLGQIKSILCVCVFAARIHNIHKSKQHEKCS